MCPRRAGGVGVWGLEPLLYITACHRLIICSQKDSHKICDKASGAAAQLPISSMRNLQLLLSSSGHVAVGGGGQTFEYSMPASQGANCRPLTSNHAQKYVGVARGQRPLQTAFECTVRLGCVPPTTIYVCKHIPELVTAVFIDMHICRLQRLLSQASHTLS